MSTDTGQPAESTAKRRGLKIALVGAGVAAGAIGTTALGANAATPSATTGGHSAVQGATAGSGTAPSGRPDPGGAKPVRSDESQVTGSKAATLKAAALKAVPGATVIRVETDAGDAAYEVHMKKADGSLVTVKFDKNLQQTAVEDGMGKGDPRPPRGGDRPHR
jgi:hypothetical protein